MNGDGHGLNRDGVSSVLMLCNLCVWRVPGLSMAGRRYFWKFLGFVWTVSRICEALHGHCLETCRLALALEMKATRQRMRLSTLCIRISPVRTNAHTKHCKNIHEGRRVDKVLVSFFCKRSSAVRTAELRLHKRENDTTRTKHARFSPVQSNFGGSLVGAPPWPRGECTQHT